MALVRRKVKKDGWRRGRETKALRGVLVVWNVCSGQFEDYLHERRIWVHRHSIA